MKRISIAVAAVISLSLGAVLGGCQSSSNSNPAADNQTAQTVQDAAAFKVVGKTDQKLSESDLKKAETMITKGKVSDDKSTLVFDQKDISLVIITGPEDDMLSYRIQGIRNPTLVIPSGSSLKVLFVNVDDDMKHDFLIGTAKAPFPKNPDEANTVGSDRLEPARDKTYSAEMMTISADHDGVFSYFCSVGEHAKKGMWGTIAVGKNAASQKLPSGHDAGERHNHDSHEHTDMMDDMHTKGAGMMDGDMRKKGSGMMR